MNKIFHVHTYRCNHAVMLPEEDYIKRAMELGAESIAFTDHAPFPGNPFRNRMKQEQLQEYISTLQELKKKYQGRMDVQIGLEIEYLPGFKEYYQELKQSGNFDLLMIGQHFYEIEPGKYSFSLEDMSGEAAGLMDAIDQGIQTGLFDVVAHPDRSFRRKKEWSEDMLQQSQKVIEGAASMGVILEKNYSSMRHKGQYWTEFWELVPEKVKIIYGVMPMLWKRWSYERI